MFSSCFSLLSHLNSAVQVHSLQHFISDLIVPGHSTCMPVALTHVWLHPWTPPQHPHRNPPFLPQPTVQLNSRSATFLLVVLCFFSTSMTVPWLVSNFWCSCFSLLLPSLTLVCLLAFYWDPCLGILALISFFILRWLPFLLSLCSLCSFYALYSAVPYSHSITLFHVPNGSSSLFKNVS